MTPKRTTVVMALAIVFSAILLHVHTINGRFFWDDEVSVKNNLLIRSWRNVPEIFKSAIFGDKAKATGYYRPIPILTYVFDYSIWELNPLGYHITNLAIHILNSLLIFQLFFKLGFTRNRSFLVSFIFVIHPLNTAPVAGIAGRYTTVLLLFLLACFLLFLYGTQEETFCFILSIVSYALALLSKEDAVVLPFIILAYAVFFLRKRQSKGHWIFLLILILMSLGYTGTRFLLLKSATGTTLSIINEASLYEKAITLPRSLLNAVRLWIIPYNLHCEYLYVVKSLASPYVWLGTPFLLGFFYLLIRFIRPLKYTLFFLAWFFIGLAPFTNIVVPIHLTFAEHWILFPGIGFLALLVMGCMQIYERMRTNSQRIILAAASLMLLAYYVGYTFKRGEIWLHPMQLYQHDVKLEPNSFLLHNNIGVEFFRQGNMREAKKAFTNAIKVAPGGRYDVAHNNLGVTLQNEGNLEDAEGHFVYSIKLNEYELAFENLGRIYVVQGRLKEAIEILNRGIYLYPRNFEINYLLAVAYFHKGEMDSAGNAFLLLKALSPGYKDVDVYLRKISEGRTPHASPIRE